MKGEEKVVEYYIISCLLKDHNSSKKVLFINYIKYLFCVKMQHSLSPTLTHTQSGLVWHSTKKGDCFKKNCLSSKICIRAKNEREKGQLGKSQEKNVFLSWKSFVREKFDSLAKVHFKKRSSTMIQ